MPSTGPEGHWPPEDGGTIHVAVGVVRGADGSVLIARRPPDVHQGGRWEFPGGKVGPGETVSAALGRELDEELRIRPLAMRPLIRVPWRYPGKHVLLDTWEVASFRGQPTGREGQSVVWVPPAELVRYRFPDANAAIVTAARLPGTYLITPDARDADGDALLERLRQHVARGVRLLQLRLPGMSEPARHRLAARVMALARETGAQVLLNGDTDAARALGAGVHLRASQLHTLGERPLPDGALVGASCHDAAELERAVALRADFAVLGPVRPTASHPGAIPLGDEGFRALVRDRPLPVYALGGLVPEDLPRMQACRAQGIAGIRGLWETPH